MLGCKGLNYVVSGENPLIKFTATTPSCLELAIVFITPVHTGLSCCLEVRIFHLPFAVAVVLGFFKTELKASLCCFMDLTLKPDFGYKTSRCNSLAVISSQARSQHMNITFKGSMSEVARKTRRWKLDIVGRNSSGGNWFKYLTKAWKSCTQGKRKKHRITGIAPKYRAKYNSYLT